MSAKFGSIYRSIWSQLSSDASAGELLTSLVEQLQSCFPSAYVSLRVDGEAGAAAFVTHAAQASSAAFEALVGAGLDVELRAAVPAAPSSLAVVDRRGLMERRSGRALAAIDRFGVQKISLKPVLLGDHAIVGEVVISERGELLDAEESRRVVEMAALLAGLILSNRGRPARASSANAESQLALFADKDQQADTLTPVDLLAAQGEEVHVTGHVLVVEDDPAVGAIVKRALVREGYSVDLASDPFEGLELLQATPKDYELLFLDYTMPGIDGLDLACRARAIGVDAPILMISGVGAVHMRASAGLDSVDAFVSKPFTSDGLLAAMGEARLHRSAS